MQEWANACYRITRTKCAGLPDWLMRCYRNTRTECAGLQEWVNALLYNRPY